MAEKFPIKDTKEVVSFLGAFMSVLKQARADGKLGLEDLALLIQLMPTATPAFDGISNVSDEASDLSNEEEKDLMAHIDEKFGNGAWEKYGEEILQASVHLARIYTFASEQDEEETTSEG